VDEIKSKLNELLNELDTEYRQWYRNKSKQSFWIWMLLQFAAILPGFIVSIVVAISSNEQLVQNKPWIVILTAFGSFVSFILVQFKIYDIWKIRADGEVAFDNLYRLAIGKVAIAQNQEDCFKVYEEIRGFINEIESDAVKRYFALSTSEFVATWKNR
jgi:hypothetical protein